MTPEANRQHHSAVWLILVIHAGLLARIAVVNAPVFDECAHLPSGLSHWQTGTFDLYLVNPPLVRMLASLPVLCVNSQGDWPVEATHPYDRPEFPAAYQFLRTNKETFLWFFTLARWALIPVSMFGGWICFRWSRELYGTASGFVSLALWCFCPDVLAWGATIMPDAGAAAFGVCAGYTFWRWLQNPVWGRALIAGLALGLCELTKTTWIVLFPLWPVIWLSSRVRRDYETRQSAPLSQMLAIVLLAVYVVNLGYGLEYSFQRLGSFHFISRTLGGPEAHTDSGNVFRETPLEAIRVPFPANYVRGMDVQKYELEKGKWSFLRGEHRHGGWWYYYLYALAVKTPLGTLSLLVIAGCLTVFRADYRIPVSGELCVLVPAAAILVLVSSAGWFQQIPAIRSAGDPESACFRRPRRPVIHLRHRSLQVICGISLLSGVVGSLSVFPHSMSYFNLAAGGPSARVPGTCWMRTLTGDRICLN
ncbi:MAG: glycosyltransferase family 39 protein [Planctomycetaceae bacterium]